MKVRILIIVGAALLYLPVTRVAAQTTTAAPATVQRAVSATALRAVTTAAQTAAARTAAKATNTTGVMPPELTNAFQRTATRTATWQDDRGTRHEERVPGAQLMEAYQAFAGQDIDDGPVDYDAILERFIDADIATLNNGLADEENLELFETTDLDRIIALVIKGLGSIVERS